MVGGVWFMRAQASDICGLGLIMSDFLIVRSCNVLSATVLITLPIRKQRPCRLTQLALVQWLQGGTEGSLSLPFAELVGPHHLTYCLTSSVFLLCLGNVVYQGEPWESFHPWEYLLCSLSINAAVVLDLKLLKDSGLCKPTHMSISIYFTACCEPYESGLHATHARYRSQSSTCAVHGVCQ